MFEFLKKKKEKQAMDNAGEKIVAVMNGTIFPLEEVSDPAFAGKILGEGIAFTPTEKQSTIVSPVDGEITCLSVSYTHLCDRKRMCKKNLRIG